MGKPQNKPDIATVRHAASTLEISRVMTSPDPGARRPRTQAERSDATRQLVVDAALRVLHAQGYSGATIGTIRDAAGVSTGALNHQFPTKASLMVAVVTHFYDEVLAVYTAALSGAPSPRAAIEAVLDTTDKIIRLPEVAAVFEIHLARRNDAELDRLTKPVYERFDRLVRVWIRKARRAVGIGKQASLNHFHLLNFAVYRGLAMEMIGKPDDQDMDLALMLWRKTVMRLAFEQDIDGASSPT